MKHELCGENLLFNHGGGKPVVKRKNLTAAKLMYVFTIRVFIVCPPPHPQNYEELHSWKETQLCSDNPTKWTP